MTPPHLVGHYAGNFVDDRADRARYRLAPPIDRQRVVEREQEDGPLDRRHLHGHLDLDEGGGEIAEALGVSRISIWEERHSSTADLAGHQRAEQFPALAGETHHLHLFDRRKIVRTHLGYPGIILPRMLASIAEAPFLEKFDVRNQPQ
jgi:hypothetical protein